MKIKPEEITSVLKKEIEKYEGTILNGIHVTESGILAAAHLGGAGSVKKYFKNKMSY